ncbi:MAG: tetratricopeptide repeat protein, partial [Pseudomonadota bacterium]
MKIHRFSLNGTSQGYGKLSFILAFILFLSCAPKSMTLEEAKQVTVSTSEKSFTPPPRGIQDILSILEGTTQQEIKELKEVERIANALPPQNASDNDLVAFFLARMDALNRLGRMEDVFKTGEELGRLLERVDYTKKVKSPRDSPYFRVGRTLKTAGDYRKAIQCYERAIGRAKFITGAYKDLVELYLETGNLEMAKRRLDEGTALCIRLSNPRFP